MTTRPVPLLSFAARRVAVERIKPLYFHASLAQKTLLLDTLVAMTGYARKYAIGLLNKELQGKRHIKRQRLSRYDLSVQQALVLAWNAARHICSKRLIPFLPTLLVALERHGHVQLTEERRSLLLSMSASTADRLLRPHRKPASRGLVSTQAGPLLKQQVPLRTFQQWDEAQPGFLEADLVAHSGRQREGSFLYTLTLTDVATGWTECLPLLYKSPEAVVAAFHQARHLFPFPILGLDVDNGGEFMNESLMHYCRAERITFTRGRPDLKADQCFVEQKNGAIVRQMAGYDRLVGEQAFRQLRELYRAVRLYVNCFQPSMKLVFAYREGENVRRVYDPAKTPVQRLLLSGMISAEGSHHLSEVVQSLDLVSLLQHLKHLQQALQCCVANVSSLMQPIPSLSILSFDLQWCTQGTASAAEKELPSTSMAHGFQNDQQRKMSLLDWRRTSQDPFEGQWEQILDLVLTHPEWGGRTLFQEMQRLFPGRYRPSHQYTLQSGLRHIRARLLPILQEPWPQEVIQSGILPSVSSPSDRPGQEADQHASAVHDVSDRLPAAAQPEQVQATALSATYSSPTEHTTSGEVSTLPLAQPFDKQASAELGPRLSFQDASSSLAFNQKALQANCPVTIRQAIKSYLQEQRAHERRFKTMEWHQTALHLFQHYLLDERHLSLLCQITEADVRGWIAFLRTTPSINSKIRSTGTIVTYARSARAFCHWAVRKGHLEHTPFVKGSVPTVERKPICLIEMSELERLLLACRVGGEHERGMQRAAARNRVILWMFFDTGMRVSELCGLRLGDVNREQGTVRIGAGGKERRVTLSPQGWDQLVMYMDLSSSLTRMGQESRGEDDPLFLTETYQPLSPNSITLLFGRLRERAGLDGRQVTPLLLRDTFAIRYLLAGGEPTALCEILGLKSVVALIRYQRFANQLAESNQQKR